MKYFLAISILLGILLYFPQCKNATNPEQPMGAYHDLYISPSGNNKNSGMSWNTAIHSISYASKIMKAFRDKERIIHLDAGTFSQETTGEKFPIEIKLNAHIMGSGTGKTIIKGLPETELFKVPYISLLKVKISQCTIENAKIGISGVRNSGIEIENVIVQNCSSAGVSAGLACEANLNNVIIQDSDIGISFGACSGNLQNVLIHHCNKGLFADNSRIKTSNCTIVGNQYGIEGWDTSTITLINSIIYYNSVIQVYLPYTLIMSGSNKLIASYSDIQNGISGVTGSPDLIQFGNGMIDTEPKFVDALSNDYHLSSDSPCRDAGDPAPQYSDADGSRNDLGAYGGQGGDSMPECCPAR